MKIRILASARRDLIDGFWFYEKQEQGLGGYFRDSLNSDIDSLQIHAGIHVKQFGEFHRMLSKRFPFAVYYRIEQGGVDVHAVLDCRRDPVLIQQRLT